MRLIRISAKNGENLIVACAKCNKRAYAGQGTVFADLDAKPILFYHQICAPEIGEVIPVNQEK